MAIGIDDLYDEEDDGIVEQQVEQVIEPQNGTEEEDNFTSEFLKTKGITDPTRIKFEEEDGSIIERNWNDLTREEQINILNTPVDNTPVTKESTSNPVENELTDEEIELLNTIRQSNLTPSQYLQQFQQPQEPIYKVDDLEDDDLYILDLESKVGELSDEDAAQALAVAKQNETLFKKQIEGIRKEYKEREDFLQQQEEANIEEQQRIAFEQYSNNIIDAIDQFNTIGNLDLNFEDSDRNELASFILSQDESGQNYLYQALQDPETLVKAAWFILNGEEAFNGLSDYFINEIKLKSDAQYKKGLEDGKNGTQTRVIINNNKKSQGNGSYSSIDDLYDE